MNPRNPIMAAGLVASLGLIALGTAYATDTPPARDTAAAGPICPPPVTETNPLNVLTALIACETDAAGPIKRDIGNRLIRFVLSTDSAGAPLFVSRELLETIPVAKRDTLDHIAAVVPPATGTDEVAAYYASIRNWVAPRAGTRGGTAAEIAELYLVMGDANPPSWVTGNAVLSRVVRPATTNASDCRQGLIPGLLGDTPATGAPATRRTTRAWRNGIGVSNKDETGLFLFAATSNAHSLLADSRTCVQLRTSITANEDRPLVPVGPGGPRRLTVGAISARGTYNYNDMYNDGGVGGRLVGEGQLPGGGRGQVQAPYYLKLETTRDAATGDLNTFVAIYDNSENPGYVRRVPLTARGDNPIQHATGRWNLVLNITATEGGDLSIALTGPGGNGAENAIRTSASELGRARYDQVVRKSTLPDGSLRAVNVGGQNFIVGYQGGTDGTALLYPANMDSNDWRQVRPRLSVVTSRIGGDGDFTPVSGRPNLGSLNGRPYHLEMENGEWVVKDGVGDPPPAATTTGGTPTPGAGTPLDQAAAAGAAGADNWTDDAEANRGLDQETRARYRIQRRNATDGALEYNVITPANFVPNSARSYRGVVNMRGLGHYLVYEAGTGVAYQDLLVAATQNSPSGPQADFATVMQVANKGTPTAEFFSVAGSGGATDLRWLPMTDKTVFMDGLKRYLGYTDAQVDVATTNLRTLVGSNTGRYIINNARAGRIVATVQNGARKVIYPQIANDADAPADNPGTQPGQTGQLLTEQNLTWSADAPFEATITVESNVTAGRVIPAGTAADATANAALYRISGTPATPTSPTWFLLFKFRELRAATGGNAGTTNIARTFHIPMFQGHNPPAVAEIHIKGYPTFPDTGVSLNTGARIVKVDGTREQKGAWVFLRSAGQPSENNCVGPVIWWGISEAEARTQGCKSDGRIQ